MIQKVIRVGTSLGVTIPKKKLEELGLKVGDEVEIFVTKPGEMPSHQQIIYETEQFMKLYGPALKRLADR